MAVFLCSGSSSSRGQFFASFLFCFQGFRCDVREFLGGILGLVRPSGPWCFPVRQGCVAVFLCSGSSSTSGSSSSQFFANKQQQQQQQEEHRHQQQQQQQQPIFCKFSVLFLGFQTWRSRVFGWDSRTRSSFRAMAFPRPAGLCGRVFVQWRRRQQQQQPIFCKFSVLLLGFRRDVRKFLGGILGLVRPSGPWCFPVRQGCVAVFLCSGSSSSSSSSQFFASVLFCF